MALDHSAVYLRDNSSQSYAVFVGSRSTTNITVTSVLYGTIATGMILYTTGTNSFGVINGGSGTSWTTTTSGTIASSTMVGILPYVPGNKGWSLVGSWLPSHVYTVGQLVRNTSGGSIIIGSTSGNTLVVSSLISGTITPGQYLYYTSGGVFQIVSGSGLNWDLGAALGISSQMMQTSHQVDKFRVYVCAVAGTSGANEPNWLANASARGSARVEGTVTWIECTGNPALNGDVVNAGHWTTGNATLGQIILNIAGGQASNSYIFICTTAGTQGATEPTWNVTTGSTTSSGGTAVWTCLGPPSNYPAWSAPGAVQSNMSLANGGSIFVANDHSEAFNGISNTLASEVITPPAGAFSSVTSINPAVIPPTSGSILKGATIGVIGPYTLNIPISSYGINFFGTANAGGIGSNISSPYLDNCDLNSLTYTSSSTFSVSGDSIWNNCRISVNFGSSSVLNQARLRIQNSAPFLSNTSPVIPNNLFTTGVALLPIEVIGCDLTNNGSNAIGCYFGGAVITFVGCKLSATATIIGGAIINTVQRNDLINCDSGATNYTKSRYEYMGTQTQEIAIVRTNGAKIDVTNVSDKIVTNGFATFALPFHTIRLGIWVDSTGSPVTATLFGVWNGAVLPNNDEVCFELDYSSSASSPLMVTGFAKKLNPVTAAAPLTADTSAWDSKLLVRVSGTPYTVGQAFSVPSAPGQVWFCTVAGTSSGSLPAGYTGAADGTTVVDGSASFLAGVRFRTAITFTPMLKGPAYARPRIARLNSTYYLDPLVVLS